MMEREAFQGRVLCGAHLELGEGPTYDPATDTAWWFDIKGKALHALELATGTKTVHPLPFLGSVMAVVDAGRQLIVSDQGLFIRNTGDGSLSLHVTLEDKPENRSNDGRMHPSGALWASTMGRKAEDGAGAIYHVAGTTVTKLFDGITIPNGICFSPDGSVGYYVDSIPNRLMRVALDPATGLPTGTPTVLVDAHGSDATIDGAITDAEGNIWNATWGIGAVDVYRPDGTRIARYGVPAKQSSCPAAIGRKADRVLVTSAWQDYGPAEKAADPRAGNTFELGVSFKGKFEPAFRL
ncbi:SMP-30/gluconolactonase/LRE family protein [Rhizobium sp. SG2393]|uniref:SMP-30/gluconolactonase/LRE family protein n=1 Tax=Rhizobium sp. SG2393 TaxID=3276279 RepID=UPI00366D85B2